MSAEGAPKRLDRRVAWTAAVIGAGVAAGGVLLGSEKALYLGAAGTGGGILYHWATNPERRSRSRARMESGGTIFQRAREIYLPGRRKAA